MIKVIPVLLLFCFNTALAQYKRPFFHTLTVENGLPEANIVSSLQDKLGYMWFGTQNGLVRYDGYQLKRYPVLNEDGLPVGSSKVNYLYEDRSGKLWAFFYQEGLYYYDRTKDIFLKVPLDKQTRDKLKAGDFFRKWIEDWKQQHFHWFFAHYAIENLHHIYLFNDSSHTMEDYSSKGKGKYFIPIYHGGADLIKDANGKMWVMADSLLSYFDWKTKTFQPCFVLPDSSKKYMFSVITPDPVEADILWLNTWIPGESTDENTRASTTKFLRFNTKTKAYKIFTPADIDRASIPANSYKSILTDSLKRVWISTKKAIALYNPETAGFTNFTLNIPLSNNDVYVQSIATDTAGNLWMGGNFKGLFYLDIKKAAVIYYPITENEGSLPYYYNVDKIFFDRTGTLWVNMPFVGIAFLDRQRSLFAASPIAPSFVSQDKKNDPNQYKIRGMDGDSIFFITDTAGLFAWNYKQNSFKKIDLVDKKLYKGISTVVTDKDESLWIGTVTNQGLINYNTATKTIKEYLFNPTDSSSISNNLITSLLVDKTGFVWIFNYEKGICKLDKKSNSFIRFPFIKNDNTKKVNGVLDDDVALSSYLDADGILWIGTDKGGLNRLETATGKFTSFLDYKNGFFCVLSIFEDSHKRLWAGTYYSGLFLVDKKTGALTKYSEKDGLINNAIMSIKEDAAGNIWLTTPRGLSRFDPVTKQFKNYPMEISLDQNYLVKDRNGLFHIITKKGLVSFDPSRMNENAVPPPVIIESISYHTDSDKDAILFTGGRSDIKLNYNENRIVFNYVALNYERAKLNRYAYKLDGYDKNWIQGGTERTTTYTNLSPGNYTFHVKASNSNGVWNETGASFTITILPPWWKTWWAYCIYALLVGGSIWAFVQYRSRALRKENIVLEDKVNDRTKQLQQSIETLKATQSQLIQSEKMASLGELTAGIAHEIQNPLNFVNNFSEVSNELIKEMVDEIDKGNNDEVKAIANDLVQNLEKINQHGKRADAIVKGMLQHSRSSSGQKEPTDINKLADEYLRLAFHGLRAKDKTFNATLKTDFDETIGNINIIPQDIGRVILNLITNAFYVVTEKKTQQHAGYEPTVSVSTKKITNAVEIKVSDNGNGISQKILDKIFQPFFTTKPTGKGTGLGLSLSYDIIKGHGGELKVETKEGEGSTFIILLPVV